MAGVGAEDVVCAHGVFHDKLGDPAGVIFEQGLFSLGWSWRRC